MLTFPISYYKEKKLKSVKVQKCYTIYYHECNNPCFARIVLIIYYMLFASVCILVGISGFWFKKGIWVILDSGVLWSFGEQG